MKEPFPRKLLLIAAATLATVATVRVASAHALDIAYLRIEPPATASAPASVVLDIDIGAAALLLGVEPSAMTEAFIGAHTQELAQQSFAKELPSSTGGPCTLGAPKAELASPSIRVNATLVCPPGARKWSFSFVTDARIPKTFQLLVKDVASDQLTVVDRAAPVVEMPEPTPGAVTTPANAARGGTDANGTPPPKPTGSAIGTKTVVGGAVLLVVILLPLVYLVSRRKTA
ncbi:MAG TPA: hypothetical protein VGM90_15380 [Kofleriaceae bacterium]|jgi:hypothetical protein